MDSLKSRIRKNLIEQTTRLKKRAKQAAALPSANDDDRKILKDDAKLLASSVKKLVKIIETHDALVLWAADVSQEVRPEHKAKLGELPPVVVNGLADLLGAVVAAYHIGFLGFESPIMKQSEKDCRAERARKGLKKLKKSQELNDDILKLAKPIWEEHPDWTAGRITAEIAGPFNKNCHRDDQLRDNTIEKRVRALLKPNAGN